jgi:hypothetical protein
MAGIYTNANKFLNCREWRSFLNSTERGAPPCPNVGAPYPNVVAAFKAGRAWLSGGAVTSYSWLLVNGNLIAGARKTLGI